MAPPQNCYCQINTSELGCENFDYEEIFATIPDIFDVTLYGNDSQEGIRASKIILASLGPIFDRCCQINYKYNESVLNSS